MQPVSAWAIERFGPAGQPLPPSSSCTCFTLEPTPQVLTFRRAASRPCEWYPRKLLIEAADEETVQDLCAAIGRGIEGASAGRPR